MNMKKYIALCPEDSLNAAFYLRPLAKPTDKLWYSKKNLGHNSLTKMVTSIMSDGGCDGFYTNHSLRATVATRLFDASVDEQLIMGVTGHRIMAVRSYKRPSDEKLADISNIISGGKVQNPDMVEKPAINTFPLSSCAGSKHIKDQSGDTTINIYGGKVVFR